VRYRVTLEPSSGTGPVTVEVLEQENGTLSALVDGRHVAVDAVALGSQLSVRVDGEVVDLTARGSLPDLAVVARNLRGRVLVESDRIRVAASPAPGSTQPKTIRSPMPGRVVRVPVQAGDAVRTGQALVVLEAMKMENEVLAAHPGTVIEVHVIAGAAVEANAKLLTLIATAT
jgi:biotin carboxyl carrier protein